MFLSKNPQLSIQRLLVFGAVGYYIYSHVKLKQKGQLGNEPDLMVNIDKKKMFDMAEKRFQLNPMHRSMLEGLYDQMFKKEGTDGETP